MSAGAQLRELLARPGLIRSFAAHDVFTARVMEEAGAELLFLGGFGAAASRLGFPDVGLMTLSEMADAVRAMTGRVDVPVIADGDTGHGGLQNVVRTIEEFERAGAAGVILEDQLAPKRCGHFSGKAVVDPDEMVLKLETALAARRDKDFVVFARTDAIAVEGFEAAVARAKRYVAVGADVCFLEAPTTREELAAIPQRIDAPQMANMLIGGTTPILTADELEDLGFKIAVIPVSSLLIAGFAIRKLTETFLREGSVLSLADEMLSFDEVKHLLGLPEILKVADVGRGKTTP